MKINFLSRYHTASPGCDLNAAQLENFFNHLTFDKNWSGGAEAAYLGLGPAGQDLGSHLVDEIYVIVITHDILVNGDIPIAFTDWKRKGIRSTDWAQDQEHSLKDSFLIGDNEAYTRDAGQIHLRVFRFKPNSDHQAVPGQQSITLGRLSDGFHGSVAIPDLSSAHFEQISAIYTIGDSQPKALTQNEIPIYFPNTTQPSTEELRTSRQFRFRDGIYNHLQEELITSSQITIPPPAHFLWGQTVPALLIGKHSDTSIATLGNSIAITLLVVIICCILVRIAYITSFRAKPADPKAEYRSRADRSQPFRVQMGVPNSQMILIGELAIMDETRPSVIGKNRAHYSAKDISIMSINAPQLEVDTNTLIFLNDGEPSLSISPITGEKVVQVYLSPNAITDCSARPDGTPLSITFDISTLLFKDEDWKGESSLFQQHATCLILVEPVAGVPNIRVKQDQWKAEHRLKDGAITLGTVIVKNDTTQAYAKSIQPGVEISAAGPSGTSPVFLLRPTGETDLGNRKLFTPPLAGRESVTYDITFDLTSVPNLATTAQYEFRVMLTRSDEPPYTGSLTLKPDPTTAYPLTHIVMTNKGDEQIPWHAGNALLHGVEPHKVLTLKREILYSGTQHYLMSLRLSNVAQVRQGSVNYKLAATEQLSSEIEKVGGDLLAPFQSSVDVKNGPNDVTIHLSLLPQRLRFKPGKKDGIVTISIEITATTDQEGKQQNWRTQTIVLGVPLSKDLGSKWLALDFGTAATVALFGEDFDGQASPKDIAALYASHGLLNLRDRYIEIVRRASIREEGTPFLPSDLMLTDSNELLSESDPRFIHLAPGVDNISNNSARYIPFLKSIIGQERIPLPKPIKFKNEHGEVVVDRPSVRPVLTSVYRTIFDDIIVPLVSANKNELNQLVLTVPNTFSALHLEFLRNVVAEASGNRFLETEIISESDAVACYYAKSWYRLNGNRSSSSREDLKNEEYILVYDMGAGTLDLSYLKLTKENYSIKKIEVIDKIGKPLAGNALDYWLATEVNKIAQERKGDLDIPDLISKPTKEDVANPSRIARLQNNRIQLREAIRRGKESMSSPSSAHPISFNQVDFWGGVNLGDIDWSQIAGNDTVHSFIKSATTGIIDQFFAYLGYTQGQVQIDTIILSGRSTKFLGIKETVQAVVSRWMNPAASERFATIHLPEQDLKTAVALGALAYVTTYRANDVARENRTVSGRYGFLYTDAQGKWQFISFLNRDTPSVKTDHGTAFEATHSINCEGTGTLLLIHTYSSDPAKDKSEERLGEIPRIASWTKAKIGMKPRITLRLTSESRLSISFNGTTFEDIPFDSSLQAGDASDETLWPLYLS